MEGARNEPQLSSRKLRQLQKEYASDLHFTPFQAGSSYGMLWIWRSCTLNMAGTGEAWFARAVEELRRGQGMYTLRRPYYESIAELYFLYDDFKDRAIHFEHGMQMAGAEFTGFLLRTLLELREVSTRTGSGESVGRG